MAMEGNNWKFLAYRSAAKKAQSLTIKDFTGQAYTEEWEELLDSRNAGLSVSKLFI